MVIESRAAPPGGATYKKPKAVVYPESDGKPLAETDIHFQAITAFLDLLRRHYADRSDVYIAGCNFVYYKEGDNKARFSPDAYVVFGVDSGPRRSYFLWKEKRSPSVVFEFTSRKTKKVDATTKKELCLSLGVKEYFMCDPESAYLNPPLQGFRLKNGVYQPVEADKDGRLPCRQLGMTMQMENRRVVLFDATTGERILSAGEFAKIAQAENALLREELQRLKNPSK